MLKRNVNKISNFSPKPWTNPFGKMPILGLLKPIFSLSRKVCLLYKRSQIVFHDLFSRSITWEYRGLQGVTKGYKGLHEVTRGYRGLQGVTEGYKWLQGVTKNYRNFFLTRTFPHTFSWLILHKNQS